MEHVEPPAPASHRADVGGKETPALSSLESAGVFLRRFVYLRRILRWSRLASRRAFTVRSLAVAEHRRDAERELEGLEVNPCEGHDEAEREEPLHRLRSAGGDRRVDLREIDEKP